MGVLIGTYLAVWPLGQSSQAPRHDEMTLFSLSLLSDAQWSLGASDSQILRFCELYGGGEESPLFSLLSNLHAPHPLWKGELQVTHSPSLGSRVVMIISIPPKGKLKLGAGQSIWEPSPTLLLSLLFPIHTQGLRASLSFPRDPQIPAHSQCGVSTCLECPCDLFEFFSLFFFP